MLGLSPTSAGLVDQQTRRRARNIALISTATMAILLTTVGVLGLRNADLVRRRGELQVSNRDSASAYGALLRQSRSELWRVDRRLRDGRYRSDPDEFQRRIDAAREALARTEPSDDHPVIRAQWELAEAKSRRILDRAQELSGTLAPPAEVYRLEDQVDEARTLLRGLLTVFIEAADERADALTDSALRLQRWSLALVIGCAALALAGCYFSVSFVGVLFDRLAANQDAITRISGVMLEKHEELARRFSHELHDELGQSLTAVKAHVAGLKQADPPAEFERQKRRALSIVDGSLSTTRNLSQLMHPRVLDDLGLAPALEWLADGFSERTQIAVEQRIHLPKRLEPGLRHHIFRIAQEAFTNIARHSGATKAGLVLEQRTDGSEKTILLRVTDNGTGLPSPSEGLQNDGFGLVGMRARAAMVGGTLTVSGNGDRGLCLEVTAPAVFEEDESTADECITSG